MSGGVDEVANLRIESQINPCGIDVRTPGFSWTLSSPRRGVVQSAYRIVAALADQPWTDATKYVWDTGVVASGQSVHIPYQGQALESRRRYQWKVKVWDTRGVESDWSHTALWEMALLDRMDWKARWIEPDQEPAIAEDPIDMMDMFRGKYNDTPDNVERLKPPQYLRKCFELSSEFQQARAYVTAHGIYRLEINGRRVGDREFAPEYTSYHDYLQYQTYDVTDFLVPGENAVGVVLADGWFAGRISITGDSCQYGNRLGLLLQLEIELPDGSRQTIVSDGQFKSSTGPLLYSDLVIGEKYDARLEITGWSNVNFDDSCWRNVTETECGFDNLVASYGEPVRAVERFPAKEIIHTSVGETVVDIGQVIAGRIRVTLRGAAGTEVTLEHSEVLDERGNFMRNINGRNKDQKDVYILRGGGDESYEPQFTFHGFRYVKISGYDGLLNVTDVTAVVISSDLRLTGSFECSDSRINRLQQNIVWSQKANFLSIPTDCPQRERAGWTGDIQVFAPTACFNMDVQAFLTRWLRNLAIEQTEDGQVPNIVPWDRTSRMRDEASGNLSSAGWGDACVIVPWTLYQAYGDKRVLIENYDTMVKWVDYVIKSAGPTYLWNTGFHFGDWLTPSLTLSLDGKNVNMMNSAILTKELVATCFYAYSTELMAAISDELGKRSEAVRYRELNTKVRQAFAEQYLQPDGRLQAHFQGIYVLALRFKMVPETRIEAVFGQLIRLIEENGNKLDTGFMSVPFLMDVLCVNGRKDLAYKLLFQTECPSWLYEVENGATTIWESWAAILPDGRVNRVSYNHYAFGCIGDWMYRKIAGLGHLEPGYKTIRIEPDLDCGLTYAKAAYDCLYGTVSTHWTRNGNRWSLEVRIPPNTEALVFLPLFAKMSLLESGAEWESAEGVALEEERAHSLVLRCGSGVYQFAFHKGS